MTTVSALMIGGEMDGRYQAINGHKDYVNFKHFPPMHEWPEDMNDMPEPVTYTYRRLVDAEEVGIYVGEDLTDRDAIIRLADRYSNGSRSPT